MKFIHDDFLLQTAAARRLYHSFAATEPICDFHCHLSPRDIAENRQFKNLFEIWLEGDHYKPLQIQMGLRVSFVVAVQKFLRSIFLSAV